MQADPSAALQLALPKQAPSWVKKIIQMCFLPEEVFEFDGDQETLAAELVLVPTMLMEEHFFSPLYVQAIQWLRDCVVGHDADAIRNKLKKTVFLSRKNHKGMQGIINEEEVIHGLEQLGVEIFEPQLHSFKDQISFFSGVDFLIGDFNSSLHNSIFMAPESSVLMLNFFSHYQTGLSAVRRQKLGLFLPSDGRHRGWQLRGTPDAWYHVDVPALTKFLVERNLL